MAGFAFVSRREDRHQRGLDQTAGRRAFSFAREKGKIAERGADASGRVGIIAVDFSHDPFKRREDHRFFDLPQKRPGRKASLFRKREERRERAGFGNGSDVVEKILLSDALRVKRFRKFCRIVKGKHFFDPGIDRKGLQTMEAVEQDAFGDLRPDSADAAKSIAERLIGK